MTIRIDENVSPYIHAQYPSLNFSAITNLVQDSWQYADENNLYISSNDETERLFCLKEPTNRQCVLFMRIKKVEDNEWLCKFILYAKRDNTPPFDEKRWNQQLFSRFPELENRFKYLCTVVDQHWEKPKHAPTGPSSLDSDKIQSLVSHLYDIYSERPYLAEVFGLGKNIWVNKVSDHILSKYSQKYEDGDVYEIIPEKMYLCDIELTNANRERLYLFILINDDSPYGLCPSRLVHLRYSSSQETIYGILNSLHENQKDYPLLGTWGYIADSDYSQKLYPILLKETWCFSNESCSEENEINAIKKFLENTFVRLVWENKVLIISDDKTEAQTLEDGKWACFNTGLVDTAYRPIYAVFKKNTERPKPVWKLSGFDVENSGDMKNIPTPPKKAEYFSRTKGKYYGDRFYDFEVSNAQNPDVDEDHILFDNFPRLPENIQRTYLGEYFEKYRKLNPKGQDAKKLINSRRKAKERLVGLFRNSLQKAILRADWNYRTGVPMYYIREGTITILLPIALESELTDTWEDEGETSPSCDLALVMACITKGDDLKYEAKTILPLDKAYSNARLVTRPDSDWLNPSKITAISTMDDD